MKALVDVLIRFGHVFILEIYIYIYIVKLKKQTSSSKYAFCSLTLSKIVVNNFYYY